MKRIGAHVLRWGLLGLTALIIVLFFARLIFQLEGRLRVESRGRQVAEAALAVDEAKLSTRDNLHVTVMQPPAQVTVTVSPAPGQAPTVVTRPGATQVVPVPAPFPVPGPTVTVPGPSPPPPPVCHGHINLLGLCLL